MKLLQLVIGLALFSSSAIAQQEVVATFIIKQAKHNNLNVSQTYLEENAYLAFYTSDGDGELYMSNCRPVSGTQSFGTVSNFETNEFEETNERHAFEVYTFRWHFQNDYSLESGTADVMLTKVFKPQGTTFTMEITTPELDKIEYKGFMGDVSYDYEETATSKEDSSNDTDRFREDYDLVAVYDPDTEVWSEWQDGNNTFVMNYNRNGDIAHYKANGDVETYRKISEVEIDYTDSGERYQIIEALDEEGILFRFQFFDNRSIGLKMIYNNMMIQFSSSGY